MRWRSKSQDELHPPARRDGTRATPAGCACAHDGHTAIGLVLAERIAALADRLNGRIKLFFQPAEEGCRGGKALAAGGQLDDVDALLALHIGIHANSGELVVNPTEFLCSTKFDVEFMGVPPTRGLSPTPAAMHWRRLAWPPPPCSASPATAMA